MKNNNKIADFYIIGAPKTGTTSLADYLNQHSDIFFTDPKEPEFFAKSFKRRRINNFNTYLKLFNNIKKENKIFGEGSVCYYFDIESIKLILNINPNAKFIFMLRNPIDLVQSLHAQLIYRGEENITDFQSAWQKINNRKREIDVPSLCRDYKWLIYSEWGMLGKKLELLLSVLDRNSLKIIFFDDFISDTEKVYMDVIDFLELDYKNNIVFNKLNSRKYIKSLNVQKLVHILGELSIMLQQSTGIKFNFGLATFIKKLNSSDSRNIRKISNSFKRELLEFYDDDIKKLSNLTNTDLSHWYR